ncbi:hypothetical protein QJS04_geneDACA012740 [Acorus gramineus]|uniref:Uncharacterized protein n=1 Tax=Acorus gramineus TaxID=55184 RepID=A0AAV9A1Y6_ACOGR|nr:hypothetical protein QJS04_geneDACA012740 [Acorus gramineus]
MEEEPKLLLLFDFHWFHHHILSNNSPPPPPPPKTDIPTNQPPSSVIHHRRSMSDDHLSKKADDPLNNLLPKLETIFSGKASSDTDSTKSLMGRKKRPKKVTRSLSELEFEELKGFMDLGFVFSEGETDSRLMSIVPGIQRRRVKSGGGDGDLSATAVEWARRPYLSEAWEDPLRDWRFPAGGDGVDLKDHLRFWAHSVASTIR